MTGSRENSQEFVIQNTGMVYVVGGGDGTTDKQDCQMYDPSTDTWTAKTNYSHRVEKGIGFAINNKGYVGLGVNFGGPTNYSDMNEYDPVANTWTAKDAYPGGNRRDAFVFVIGNKAYVGGGVQFAGNTEKNDFYEFDPSKAAGSQWTAKANYPGSARQEISAFSDGTTYGYAGTGIAGAGPTLYTEFYQYDPGTDTWTAKANYGGVATGDAVGFWVDDKGYIATGQSPERKDVWAYTPSTDSWTQLIDFGGIARIQAIAGVVVNTACVYMGSGYSNAILNNKADWWTTCDINPLPIKLLFFNAQAQKNVVNLTWQTAAEINNDFFTVERSKDAVEFTPVAIVKGAGNSINTLSYQTVDDNPLPGISYYRLKQTDYDGKYDYSHIVSIDIKENFTFDVFPNPSDGKITFIKVSNGMKAKKIFISVYDSKGSETYKKIIDLDDFEKQEIAIDQSLTAGVYTVIANSGQYLYKQKIIIY